MTEEDSKKQVIFVKEQYSKVKDLPQFKSLNLEFITMVTSGPYFDKKSLLEGLKTEGETVGANYIFGVGYEMAVNVDYKYILASGDAYRIADNKPLQLTQSK